MIATANKKSINKLAIRSLKANKMRNIFAIIAIALTTVLFTSLFTISMSMIKSMEQSTMRQVGGSAHGGFKYLTLKQLNRIKNNSLIKEYGYSIIFSDAKNKELSSRSTEIRYATHNAAKYMFALPTKGHMPKVKNEIAADTIVLDMLHIPHKIGHKITVKYNLKGRQYTKTFVLSGYWKGDIVVPASMMWISKDFVKEQLGNNNQTNINKHIANGDYTGAINLDIMFSNSFNIENKILNVLNESGYTSKEIQYGVNWAYLSTNFEIDLKTVISFITIILIIMFSGYLIIYSIFYISVARDTRFYGMLKTIGTTSRQIKIIVKRQSSFLSIVGIPIGLITGFLVGSMLVPFTVSMTTYTCAEISSSPIIFLGSALFSFVTVAISCRKPAKIASKISPIEAIRYIDVSNRNEKKIKRSRNGAKVYKMALHNIFRSKRKAMIVIISLSFSLILFNSIYAVTKSFSMDKYLSNSITSDFAVADKGYFNVSTGYRGQATLSNEVMKDISSIRGIKDIGRIYFKEIWDHKINDKNLNWIKKSSKNEKDKNYIQEMNQALNSKEVPMHLNGLDKFVWDKIKLVKGKLDERKFATGKYIIVGKSMNIFLGISKNYYDIGDSVKITLEDGTQKSYKVMAIGEVPFNLTVRHSHDFGFEAYITSNEFKTNVKRPNIMTAIFDVKKKYINYDDKYLENYTKTRQSMLGYESKNALKKEFQKTQLTYGLVGGVLCIVIALIGVLNFINGMATGIVARKRENAMLQGIGMTDKQLYKMLVFEGVYYAAFTILISIFLVSALNYYIVNSIVGEIWFFSYHFTLLPIAICAPILTFISVIVPIICYKASNNMSIVERLGEAE